jgi:hypothetical protein
MPLLDGSGRLSSPVAAELSVQPLVVLKQMITNDNLIWLRSINRFLALNKFLDSGMNQKSALLT